MVDTLIVVESLGSQGTFYWLCYTANNLKLNDNKSQEMIVHLP